MEEDLEIGRRRERRENEEEEASEIGDPRRKTALCNSNALRNYQNARSGTDETVAKLLLQSLLDIATTLGGGQNSHNIQQIH